MAGYDGLSALHWACDRGTEHFVRILIEEGAMIDRRAFDGQTPLHYAASCGHANVVSMLLKAGADREAKDEEGNRPIDLAEDSSVQKLLEE